MPWRSLLVAGGLVAVAAVLLIAVLPAPKVSTSLAFTSASPNSQAVNSANNLTDGNAALPAHAASPSGRTKVGGFLGFAKSLDTADRVSLGNEVVMRVRASRPNYWVGQTFDEWNGQSWVQSTNPVDSRRAERITGGSPFVIPTSPDQVADLATETEDVQTFYLTDSTSNLVFHADNVQRLYLQTHAVLVTADGTIASTDSMGPGTIYTVVSNDTSATPAQLQASTVPGASDPGVGLDTSTLSQSARYLQLPHPYPQVAALAASITAGIGDGTATPSGSGAASGSTGSSDAAAVASPDPHTYQKVEAVERWMTTHVHYTTDIPPLAAGTDAVNSFLFGTRRGYCEQISTATVVMLRSLGIPAREAVGYVPGSFNPITDLYDVQAKDAHAWVQVWFPGYGWQNFDPTADVPLANPAPGSVLATSFGHALGRVPWIPVSVVLMAAAVIVWVRRRQARRPATWAHQVAADLADGGARLGLGRRPDETLSDYGRRLSAAVPEHARDLAAVTTLVERATYGGIEPSADQIAAALTVTRRFRGIPRRRGRASDDPGRTSGPDGGQDRAWASASSNDAPAASSGR